jgi:flotillin
MYNQAAILEQLLADLPSLAAAIASPLAQTERIVVIGSGNGPGAGASRVTGDVTEAVAQVPAVVEALTGVDIVELIRTLPGVAGLGEPEPESAVEGGTEQAPAEADGDG